MVRKILLVSVLLLTVSLTAHAQPQPLRIVASFSILADVAQQVAGDAAAVESLMPLGADPHSFTPAPSALATIADADVVFVSGIGFEEALLESIESAAPSVNLVTVSSCVPVLPFGIASHDDEHDHDHEDEAADHDHDHEHALASTPACDALAAELAPAGEGETEPLGRLAAIDCGTAHEHEHEGETEAEHAEHSHEAGSCDPHVWFDPYNVQLWALAIRDTLSALDPANAETYAANAAAYVAELEALRAEIGEQVDSLAPEQRVLVTNHGSLGYFASAYGFEVVGLVVPASSSAAEPSAAQLAALIDTIRAQNVPAVFAETSVSPTLAEQVAAESGAQFYTLYTESLSEASAPAAAYLDFMRYNLQTIVQALGAA